MNTIFCSSEVTPFSKTGGLADVSSAIPRSLEELGYSICIITPLYKFIDIQKYDLELVSEKIGVQVGDAIELMDLYKGILPESSIPVYFIKNQFLYREGLYVNEKGIEYEDSAMRFLFFSKAIFAVLKYLQIKTDIIHSNDWHTGLVPFFLKSEYHSENLFKEIKTIFTIHNIGYQGIFPVEDVQEAGISEIYFTDECLGYHSKINFMKSGVLYSDLITTVSPTYANEIQTKEYGFGLEEHIQKRKNDLFGIVHGIHTTEWNPSIDPFIKQNYDKNNMTGKAICKSDLQLEMGLEISDNPLIGIVSRLASQKGIDLILEIFDQMMELDIQFILLGTGNPTLEKALKEKEKKYKGRCSIKIDFSNELAHKIEAGADMFLMPSTYEPCGLNQMYSMAYGTVPIVRKTGGLADTVKNYDFETSKGTCFVFDNIEGKELFETVQRAVNLYTSNPEKWEKLRKSIMKIDFSWKNSAKNWQKVYKNALNK